MLPNGLNLVRSCFIRLNPGLLMLLWAATPAWSAQTFPLIVPEGTPFEISIDRRIPIGRVGEAVEAHLVQPVFAYNQLVIPQGSRLTGHVVRLDRVPLQRRVRSVMKGDFTPLRDPKIVFEKLYFPDGRVLAIETRPASASGPVVRPEPSVQPEPKDSFTGKASEFVRAGFLNARQQLVNTLNADDKWDRLQETGYAYLPYHPQYVPKHTQVAVELDRPLTFGTVRVDSIEGDSATLPPVDSIVTARLASTVSSNSAPGTRVEAIVSQPLFEGSRLLLPEGTRLIGSVVDSQTAASWRRGGKLRFAFQWMELPPSLGSPRRVYHLQAVLAAVGTERIRNVKIDSEGGSQSVEPLSRFLAPALKAFIGSQMVDDSQQTAPQAQSGTRTWRTLAGASGFGVVGSVASQISQEAGTGLGFYGLGWSVFTHIIAHGSNVVFAQDTPIRLRLVSVRCAA